MTTKLGAMLLTAAVAFGPGFAVAQDESLEELVVQMADTAAEHEAIARHYRAKAEDARQEMRRHEGMAQAYAAGARGARSQRMQGMQVHCRQLVESYAQIAEQYDELAEFHEEEASALE